MANYVPFTQPGFPTRPAGFNTGMDQATADYMSRQGQLQSLEAMILGNQQSSANLERYQGETPSKLAEAELNRQKALGKIPHLPELLMGEVGDARGKLAAGNLAQATLPGNIAAKDAQNQGITSEQKLKTYNAMMQFIDQQEPILKAAESQGPLAAQAAWDRLLQQVPPEVVHQLPQQYTPQVSQQMIPAIRQKLVQSIAQEQALALEDRKGANQLENTREVSRNSERVARINQEGQNWRAGLSKEQRDRVKKIEETMAQLFQKSLTQQLTPQEQQAFTIGQQIMNNLAASRASGTAMGFGFMNPGQAPGFPTPAPVPAPGAPQPQAQPRQFRSEAEAIASGVKGEVIINGRRARID